MHLEFITVLVALIFSIISAVFYLINSIRSVFYKDNTAVTYHSPSEVTVVIPVYNEDVKVFRETISSISKQGSDFVVIGDGVGGAYQSITLEFGGKFIKKKENGGKRSCMVIAMDYVNTPFVMFVDSDTVVPKNGVRDLLSKFEPDVGGVGANLSVDVNGSPVSYSSEFVERSREVVFKAMSVSGSVMILDGPCAVYRTSIVKPFILSPEFKELTVFGKKSPQGMGDDRQLTSHVIRSNYRAVKNYDVMVKTQAKGDYKSYIKQQVRWSRTGWFYFFKDLFNGTTRKAGAFYTFELMYVYILPVILLSLSLAQLYFFSVDHVSLHLLMSMFSIQGIEFFMLHAFSPHMGILLMKIISIIVNGFGVAAFGMAISTNILRGKIRTFAFGGLALMIMFATFFYGLLTVWKQAPR